MAWLRQILARCLANSLRDFGRQNRDMARERSLEDALTASSARVPDWLAAEQLSPSQAAEKHEVMLQLAETLERLPDAQREALILQHWEGWTLAQIGEKMQRSPAAMVHETPYVNRAENSLSVGLDHLLAEHTKLFGFYTRGDIGGTDEKNEYVAVGIQHNF